jgi:hypothetical protein
MHGTEYFFPNYLPRRESRGGALLGKAIGTALIYAPYLFASTLFYRAVDSRPESWLWSLLVVTFGAAALFLGEAFLVRRTRHLSGTSIPISVLLFLFVGGFTYLNFWATKAGFLQILHAGSIGLAQFIGLLYAGIFITRFIILRSRA